jgi:hypothetical protein
MRIGRLARLVVGTWLLAVVVLRARPAEACGFWSMTDNEKKLDIGWLINSGAITTTKGERRIAALYLDLEAKDGIRVVTSKKVIYDIKGGKLRKYGTPVATFDPATGVSFGKRVYTIELTGEHERHGMPAWILTVKRGDTVIIESSEASALCAPLARAQKGIDMSSTEQQEEVRRRVAFYLAWREVGL